MLLSTSTASSARSSRCTRSDTPIERATMPTTGTAPSMHSSRKVIGGKSVTPTFITGQFRPHDSV